jgi:hypothetical protein
VELCPWRESVGRAVTIDELVSVSTESIDVGVPSLVRGWNPRPVIVICEGRDLRVWMSILDIESIDSWDVERRRLGWNEVDHSSCNSKFESFDISEGLASSSSDGMLGVCKSGISSISSSSS